LSELPFHLLNAGQIEDLKRDVLGKDWAKGGKQCSAEACFKPTATDKNHSLSAQHQ